MSGISEQESMFPMDKDAVWLECLEMTPERLNVRVRWGLAAPIDALQGTVAGEGVFALNKEGDGSLLMRLTENASIDPEFVRYLCSAYGIQGVIDVEVVYQKDIVDLGSVKVR